MEDNRVLLVIGGGVAGTTCAIELSRLSPSSKVLLVTPAALKEASVEQISPLLDFVHAQHRSSDDFAVEHPNVALVRDEVVSVDSARNQAKLAGGGVVHFTSRCCVATGASPSLAAAPSPRIFGIRDTSSVQHLRERLVEAERVLVIGNGGIALELVHSLVSTRTCKVVWAVRDSYIGNTFFDASASAFFLQQDWATVAAAIQLEQQSPKKTVKVSSESSGPSVGPGWCSGLNIREEEDGGGDENEKRPRSLLDIQFECEVRDVCEGEHGDRHPVSATLTNGRIVDCDFIVSATGVQPNTSVLDAAFQRGHDGGVRVDETMRVVRSSDATTAESMDRGRKHDIFAAGDCCSMEGAEHWFQVRLWRQARSMGLYAAKCMTDSVDELGSGGDFDLFVHATHFFGYKVILLGRFNGQGLGSSTQRLVSGHALDAGNCMPEHSTDPSESRQEAIHVKGENSDVKMLMRTTPGDEYVKASEVVLVGGRVIGAMLVGDTGLEETFENLILSGTDVSTMGDDLLSHRVDIEDFFD
ncbi:unnamed protein product [Scytosiphon promiscuus]